MDKNNVTLWINVYMHNGGQSFDALGTYYTKEEAENAGAVAKMGGWKYVGTYPINVNY